MYSNLKSSDWGMDVHGLSFGNVTTLLSSTMDKKDITVPGSASSYSVTVLGRFVISGRWFTSAANGDIYTHAHNQHTHAYAHNKTHLRRRSGML